MFMTTFQVENLHKSLHVFYNNSRLYTCMTPVLNILTKCCHQSAKAYPNFEFS